MPADHDKFYTKHNIVEECCNHIIQHINIDKETDLIIEPSAGNGEWITPIKDLCNNYRFYDIKPENDDIQQQDYLDFKYNETTDFNNILVIGNPPFGIQSSLAVKFFNISAQYCDVICFIVPRIFKRVSIQNRLDLNFHLLFNYDLPLKPCCFYPTMSAKCCLQIWEKKDFQRQKIIYDNTHSDFSFLKHGPNDNKNQPTPNLDADFAIKAYGSHCGTIQEDLTKLRPKSWHWIKSNIDVQELKNRFNQLDYSMSKDSVRQDSIGQKELIYLYKSVFN